MTSQPPAGRSPAGPSDAQVELRVPADEAFVPTVRLTTAALATRCEFTVDEIADVRLAVDEACALLIPHATGDEPMTVRFTVGEHALGIEVSLTAAAAAEPDRSSYAWAVLAALAGPIAVTHDQGALTIRLSKQREQLTQ